MIHGSLFSGIGGFDLAAEWIGWENMFHCEINPFCQRILKHYWPNAISYNDIKSTDFTIHRGTIDVLSGGFPCQPYSIAGKRLGKEDERHLWPEMLRAIREIQPTYVVGENVRGLINWNGGMVFDEVQSDLEAIGYEVTPFILPACAVNAPHRRERVWCIAYNTNAGLEDMQSRGKDGVYGFEIIANSTSEGRKERQQDGRRTNKEKNRQGVDNRPERYGNNGDVTYPTDIRQPREEHRQTEPRWATEKSIPNDWQDFPTQSPVRLRNDGISNRMERYITKELFYEISKTSEENRIKNLPEVWKIIQQEAVWEKVRRFYSLESKIILFKTMQLYTEGYIPSIDLSPFSTEFSEIPLRFLRLHGEFRRSPQGQELQKQRAIEFADTLPFLPHEVALAARRLEAATTKFENWHRNESIKAYGNAVVPQVVYEIFKVIQTMNDYDYTRSDMYVAK